MKLFSQVEVYEKYLIIQILFYEKNTILFEKIQLNHKLILSQGIIPHSCIETIFFFQFKICNVFLCQLKKTS